MSTLSKEQRDALPDSDFAILPARLLPILDAADVERAARRLGSFSGGADPEATKRRIIEIALSKKLRVPKAWAGDALVILAEQTQDEGLVPPAQSNTLLAVVTSEAELDSVCELARRKLKEKAMSTNFQNRHDSPEGRSALQELHDVAARNGAICTPPGKMSETGFVSKHESSRIQAIHNLAAEGGAKCRAVGDNVFSGDESGLGNPHELTKDYVERRNAKNSPVALRSSGEETEAVRASVSKHVAKRNAQVQAQREKSRKIERDGGIDWGK